MIALVITFLSSVLITGLNNVAPDDCNHSLVQESKSLPEEIDNSVNKSDSSVFFQACLSKYAFNPLRKFSSPTQATSCLNAEAPLA